jgi:L-ascorbate metabolism protein UlaG (beta-lactamase superfamily)
MAVRAGESVVVTLVGGPTAVLEIAGVRLLTDPTFDPPGTYVSNGVVLTKLVGPAITSEALGPVDFVLLSHDQHVDNLDHSGRSVLERAQRVLTTKHGAERLGGSAQGLAPWDVVRQRLDDNRLLEITATPARHGPIGIEPLSGQVIGFVLTIDGENAIYVSGDTVWYDGVAQVAARFDVRLALLFTGCAKPRGAHHMTMNVNEAIEAAHAFPSATIITLHNDGWAHFTESQSDVEAAFRTVGLGDRLQTLQAGSALEIALAP